MGIAACEGCNGFGIVECDCAGDHCKCDGNGMMPCKTCGGAKVKEPEAGCESCEGTGRIEALPESAETLPCDDCQPGEKKEAANG